MIIHEQTIIASFAAEKAVETLPLLLSTREDRQRAVDAAQFIAGPIAEMSPRTLNLLQQFHDVLGLEPLTSDVLDDPLQDGTDTPAPATGRTTARRPKAAAAVKRTDRKRAPAPERSSKR